MGRGPPKRGPRPGVSRRRRRAEPRRPSMPLVAGCMHTDAVAPGRGQATTPVRLRTRGGRPAGVSPRGRQDHRREPGLGRGGPQSLQTSGATRREVRRDQTGQPPHGRSLRGGQGERPPRRAAMADRGLRPVPPGTRHPSRARPERHSTSGTASGRLDGVRLNRADGIGTARRGNRWRSRPRTAGAREGPSSSTAPPRHRPPRWPE